MSNLNVYCNCIGPITVTSGYEDDWGYWSVCVKCKRRIEDGYHYYNHYDGKDHEEFWLPNGDIYVDGEDDN